MVPRVCKTCEGRMWLTREELATRGTVLRTPLVLRCIDDYRRGVRLPLEALASVE